MEEKNNKSVKERANFEFVRYSNCWEDADILIKALDVKEGSNFLSIASAGDNSLSLLTLNPELVLAIDLNASQLACTELKICAFKHLCYDELLAFLGVTKSDDRIKTYTSLKKHLSLDAMQYWDNHQDDIQRGFIHIGKFENYFRLFRSYCLPLIHSKARIHKLLQEKDEEAQSKFYNTTWNSLRWRLLFKVFFSQKLMGLLGRDPEFFKYVEKDVSSNILKRVRHGVTKVPIHSNPYLEYIMKGQFEKALPHYLRKENFDLIRKNIDKIVLFKGCLKTALEAYPDTKFDAFNLSDIFEYMSEDEYENELSRIISSSNKHCRVAFWNMLCSRGSIKSLDDHIHFDENSGQALLEEDKAFFYQSFKLGVVQ